MAQVTQGFLKVYHSWRWPYKDSTS